MLTKYVNKRINVRHLEREPSQNRAKKTSANLRFIFFTAKEKIFFNIYLTRMPHLGNRAKMQRKT